MKKIIDELINSSISGVDVYRYKNATWLIFTDETRWVVELTDEGTLWYNYKFFNDVFKYVSMTVGKEMEEYVIQWANDFFYKDCAHRSAAYPMDKNRNETPKVLENGIKETKERGKNRGDVLEWQTSDVIGKGIKEVYDSSSTHRQMRAENLMGRIVKDAKPHRVVVPAQGMDRFYYDPGCSANTTDIFRIVEEGIKEIKPSIWTTKRGVDVHDLMCSGNTTDISTIVKSGVKNIYPDSLRGEYDWSDEFDADKVIDNGIKIIPLPDMSGELRGYGDYYNTKEDRTKPHTEYVKDAIEGGTKL
jgi:hypothetical protein